MTFPELNKKFDNINKTIENFNNGELMVKIAIEGVSLLRKRVQETGIDAKGQKYRPYSTKAMLVGCKSFPKEKCDVVFGSKEKRKSLEWRTVNGHHLAILPGGYKQWRQIYGAQTDHVDFSVTNAMWNDIMAQKPKKADLLSTDADHKNGIAIIGAKKDSEKKKLAGNTKRRGDILDLSNSEIEGLKQRFNVGVLQIFRNNGL